MSFGLLMFALRQLDEDRPAEVNRSGPIARLAGASFTLYLVHYSIQEALVAVVAAGGLPFAGSVAAGVIVPIVLALAIAPWTEMRYRDVARWLTRRAPRTYMTSSR
ncbi:MAG: hypothetical protein EXQ95_12585 [Alphaproteobacteria bacterium]|nr:hypothetical protein [Alphaproteobacteria bacterium]